jgi:hypothetical protein
MGVLGGLVQHELTQMVEMRNAVKAWDCTAAQDSIARVIADISRVPKASPTLSAAICFICGQN